jgi:mono/diheme cytochrome c family protein
MIFGGARSAWLVLLFVGVACLGAAGCNKSGDGGTPAPPPPGPMGGGGPDSAAVLSKLPGGAEYAVGKKVYADNNCARCHKLGETGGGGPEGMMGGPPSGVPGGKKGPRGGKGGPDLTTVGADPAHTKQWLSDHVRNPKVHKPQSRMPANGPEKISDADLSALADYLSSRK